jgi:hypothetical protein
MMEFGLAFTYPFQDQDWLKKIGIAGLLMIVPIVGQIIVLGWALEIVRRVIRRDPNPLPEWSDFGRYLMDGLMLFVVVFVYSLPLTIVSGVGQVIPYIATQGSDEETMVTIITVVSVCIGCFSLIYGIILGLLLPAVGGNFAVKGKLGAAFAIGEIINLIKAAPGAYAFCLLGSLVAGIVSGLGVIACCIGVLFTAAYSMTVQAHLWGQAYNVATGSTVA